MAGVVYEGAKNQSESNFRLNFLVFALELLGQTEKTLFFIHTCCHITHTTRIIASDEKNAALWTNWTWPSTFTTHLKNTVWYNFFDRRARARSNCNKVKYWKQNKSEQCWAKIRHQRMNRNQGPIAPGEKVWKWPQDKALVDPEVTSLWRQGIMMRTGNNFLLYQRKN